MRISRIHVEAQIELDATLELTPEASHYLIQVLRLKEGDTVHPFNESEGEFRATIHTAHRKRAVLLTEELIHPPRDPQFSVCVGLGLSKGDRMDIAIQKSTELGVNEIVPLMTKYSEVKFANNDRLEKKVSHWQKIAINASEQSGRLSIPKISAPISINEWLEGNPSALKLVLSTRSKTGLSTIQAQTSCSLLIGPEGGLSESEEKLAITNGFQAISLGERILRTETAPIAALAILQYKFGDMN